MTSIALRNLPLAGNRLGAALVVLATLDGWRRRGVLAALGALAALALPPVHVLPILLLSFPGLIWMWDGSRGRWSTFAAGWWWGLGFYSVGFYWIANALLIDPLKFGWMIPFATLGLGGLIACFAGFATWLAALPRVVGVGRLFLLAAAWGLSEWLRTFVLTGFPWNPIGSVWDPILPILQVGSAVGIHGLDLMTVLVFTLPAHLVAMERWRGRLAVAALAVALPAAAYGWGAHRLATTAQTMVPGVTFRLVQGAVAQTDKWREDVRERNFQDLIALSRRAPGFDKLSAVIWSETAAPFFLDLDDVHRAMAMAAVPPGGLLLTGAPRITPADVRPAKIWNSLLAIDSQGRVRAIYDKVHLVPFGEYVPLRGILPLAKITQGGMDFSPGPGLRTLALPNLPPAGPTICYEAIFPGAVVGRDQPRPDWLLNVTNDGWFGQSAGPYQHLAAARMRAIEEGLPMVRVANTGISAVFDGLGREVVHLDLGTRGTVDSPLPRPIPPTPYGRWGDRVPLTIMAAMAVVGLLLRRSML